jgi:hypothetical protein
MYEENLIFFFISVQFQKINKKTLYLLDWKATITRVCLGCNMTILEEAHAFFVCGTFL